MEVTKVGQYRFEIILIGLILCAIVAARFYLF
ncbi:small membrane protein YdgU [Escherichia fergusonii]